MTQHSNNKLLGTISHFHLKGLDRTRPPLCGEKNSKCAANLVSRVSSLSDIRVSYSLSAGRVCRCACVGRGCCRAVLTLAIAVGLLGLDLIAPVLLWNRGRKNVNPRRACELFPQPRGPEPGKKNPGVKTWVGMGAFWSVGLKSSGK